MRNAILEECLIGFMEGGVINAEQPLGVAAMRTAQYRRELAAAAKNLLELACPDLNLAVMINDTESYDASLGKPVLWMDVYIRSKKDSTVLGMYTGILWEDLRTTVKFHSIKKDLCEHWYDYETKEWKERYIN